MAVSFLPKPDEVASILTARTFNSSSEEEGEFSKTTRPTYRQVESAIERAGNEVRARLGRDLPDDEETAQFYAQELVAVRAAMWVELTFFPEQASSDDSTFEQLRQLYESGLAALIETLSDTSTTRKGIYSIPMRSEALGYFETGELT